MPLCFIAFVKLMFCLVLFVHESFRACCVHEPIDFCAVTIFVNGLTAK